MNPYRNYGLGVLIALVVVSWMVITKHGHYFFIFVSSFSTVRNNYRNFKQPSTVFSASSTTPTNLEQSFLNNNNNNDDGSDSDDYLLRFSGAGRLLSTDDSDEDVILGRLQSATVAVIGIGGVGSWTAEALCRSGIGNIILVDLDDVCISNTNRQLHAMSSTVGHMKTDVMKQRLLDINPNCNVTIIHDFVSTHTHTTTSHVVTDLSIKMNV